MLALALGLAMGTSHGILIAGAIFGVLFCGAAVMLYLRDPVLAFIWLWLCIVFNAPISAAVGYYSAAGEAVRQSDEVLVLLLFCLTVWRTMRSDVRIPPLRFILPGIGVAVFGVLGAVFYDVPITVTVIGAWLGLKLWIMVAIAMLLPWTPKDYRRIYTVLTGVGLFVAALGLLDYVSHAGVSRALHTSIYRFGVDTFRGEAVHSIFPHPGEYSLFMSLLFGLTFARFAHNRSKRDLILALLFAGSVVLSLRLKGFLSLAAVILIVALVQATTSGRGFVIVLLVGGLLFVGIYSIEGNVITKQISTYTSSEASARSRLYKTGEHIAVANFPFGAGFGRFASYPSRLYYSPVYYQYGLSAIYGFGPSGVDFIDDTSWPSVIGETGYGGFSVYLLGVMLLIGAVISRLRSDRSATRWVSLSALCAIAVLLVDSLGDPTLFDWLATTTFALMLGPALARPTGQRSSLATSFAGREDV